MQQPTQSQGIAMLIAGIILLMHGTGILEQGITALIIISGLVLIGYGSFVLNIPQRTISLFYYVQNKGKNSKSE